MKNELLGELEGDVELLEVRFVLPLLLELLLEVGQRPFGMLEKEVE